MERLPPEIITRIILEGDISSQMVIFYFIKPGKPIYKFPSASPTSNFVC